MLTTSTMIKLEEHSILSCPLIPEFSRFSDYHSENEENIINKGILEKI